jgi:hypothetical protein
MKEIALNHGQMAIVDDDDFLVVSKINWFAHKNGNTYYARKGILKMHHIIFGKPEKGYVIDHINGNGLDNRKENLRFATLAENRRNVNRVTSKSGFKGVYLHPRNKKNKWMANICFNGKERTEISVITRVHKKPQRLTTWQQ